MSTLLIEGGRRLSGTITVEGNKNAALPLLAACLLTDQPCELTNMPRITDVGVMAQLLAGIGAEVEGIGTSTIRVCCKSVTSSRPDPVLVGRLRGSILLMGPLLARLGEVRLAPPGGDFPSRRSIGTHVQALVTPRRAHAQRIGLRPRCARGPEGRVVLSRRSVGHRHGNGAARGGRDGRRHRNPSRRDRTARRRAVRIPSGDGRRHRRRGDVDRARPRHRRRHGPPQGRVTSVEWRLHRSGQLGGARRGDAADRSRSAACVRSISNR